MKTVKVKLNNGKTVFLKSVLSEIQSVMVSDYPTLQQAYCVKLEDVKDLFIETKE